MQGQAQEGENDQKCCSCAAHDRLRRKDPAAAERIPPADRYYITLDADGLDPSISPGVLGPPAPGGVTYYEVFNLMRGIARKGRVVGFDYVEIVPALDIAHMTSVTAVRIILNLIGILAHEGQIGQ